MTPERKAELNKAYAEAHREGRRAYQRDWVAKNKEKKLAYQKSYRDRLKAKDPEFLAKEREYARGYRARNRDKVNAKERNRKKRIPTAQRRAYFRDYRREHPLTASQKSRRRKAQALWRSRNLETLNRKRRERYAGQAQPDIFIPVSSTRMEVEAEMWLATAEGRDPETARREWFAREKGWAMKTVLIRSPHSDGPLFDKEQVA